MTRNDCAAPALKHVLRVLRPAIQNRGEDAMALCFRGDCGMTAVFDGCGGLGALTYERCGGHTAAYIAARLAAVVAAGWYENDLPADGMHAPAEAVAAGLKAALDAELARARRELDVEPPLVISTMLRSFPTTAAVALLDGSRGDALDCLFLWAGDSRGLILQPDGLRQYTRDDLRTDEDAFTNLYVDSPLSNMVHGGGDYVLHARRTVCRAPAIVLTVTDGVFGYLPSPMHFEWLLLRTLAQARSYEEWEARLLDEIGAVTGDDSALVMSVWGWPCFEALQAGFLPRLRELEAMLEPESPPDEDRLYALWLEYRRNYSPLPADGPEGGV